MKYKLLKDLPGYKAHTVLPEHLWREGARFEPKDYPDWFAPIDEESNVWPQPGDRFYYLTDELWINSNKYSASYSEVIAAGNVFRTKEQAEVAAEAVKALYVFIKSHPAASDVDFLIAADKVRGVIYGGNNAS